MVSRRHWKAMGRRERDLNRPKTKEVKRKSISRKIARKEEQTIRQQWSNAHGRDTYGDKGLKCKIATKKDMEKKPIARKITKKSKQVWTQSRPNTAIGVTLKHTVEKLLKTVRTTNGTNNCRTHPKFSLPTTCRVGHLTSHLEEAMCLVRVYTKQLVCSFLIFFLSVFSSDDALCNISFKFSFPWLLAGDKMSLHTFLHYVPRVVIWVVALSRGDTCNSLLFR